MKKIIPVVSMMLIVGIWATQDPLPEGSVYHVLSADDGRQLRVSEGGLPLHYLSPDNSVQETDERKWHRLKPHVPVLVASGAALGAGAFFLGNYFMGNPSCLMNTCVEGSSQLLLGLWWMGVGGYASGSTIKKQLAAHNKEL